MNVPSLITKKIPLQIYSNKATLHVIILSFQEVHQLKKVLISEEVIKGKIKACKNELDTIICRNVSTLQ